jgi:hypothetical protein
MKSGGQKMRYLLIVLSMLLLPASSIRADVSVAIGVPGISIGINVPAYPRLVRVPGYPVYYDPRLSLNLFFYDGLYWVFQGDGWYVSSWYNGPWDWVDPYDVPVYVLRVPVRYYRLPPPYFRGWRVDAPPHWHEHWGHDWEERRRDWDRKDRHAAPPRAPLPSYQRQYSGERYPHEQEKQREIRSERYRYQPREEVTKKHYEMQRERGESRSEGRGNKHDERGKGR